MKALISLGALTAMPPILYAVHAFPVFSWFRERWASQPDTAPLFLFLLCGSCWILRRLHAQGLLGFEFRWLPSLGLLVSLSLSLLNRCLWSIGSFQAVLALTGAYCLLGFYVPRKAWRRSTIVLALLCLSLPVQDHYQDLAGFPFRLLTAGVVAELMNFAGVPSLAEASLVLSAGAVAAVDYPCSGLRFMHAGTIFFSALLLLGRAPRLRASLCAIGFLLSLLLLNVWRVFSLVYLAGVLGLRDSAERVHTALGVAGFTACCVALLLVLRPSARGASLAARAPASVRTPRAPRAALVVSAFIASCLCMEATLAAPRTAQGAPAVVTPALNMPGFTLEPLPLATLERDYYVQRGVATAGKFTLVDDQKQLQSTLLVTVATAWYVQHAPERCVRGSGHTISRSDLLHPMDPGRHPHSEQPMLVRHLVLDGGRSSLFYWFTDGRAVVADYGARVWRGLSDAPRPWALVQLMTPGVPEPDSQQVLTALLAVQRAAQELLVKEGSTHGD